MIVPDVDDVERLVIVRWLAQVMMPIMSVGIVFEV